MSETKLVQRRTLDLHMSWRSAVGPLAALLLFGLGMWNISGPGLWWDEGWTLSVARNWVERGHYGRLLSGELAPPGLEAAFTVTAPVALSFRLFGVGIWQGRMVGVLFLVAAMVLVYQLALRLYNRRVALATIFVLMLMPMHPQLHPLIMGRQVMAETPMFCYLLLGYLCLLLALQRSRWLLIPVAVCWGVALITKAQVLPFLAASLLLPIAVALFGRRWRTAGWIAAGLIGALGVSRWLPILRDAIIAGHTMPGWPVSGLYNLTALVLTPSNRLYALQMLLILGLPTLAALCYALWRCLRARQSATEPAQQLRLALVGLSGSWLAWYVLLSVGVPRYLFPATFLGSIFVAALLHDLTNGFDLNATIAQVSAFLQRRFGRPISALWILVPPQVVLILIVAITLITLNRFYLGDTDRSDQEVAAFLNTQTPQDALIETYESEIQFLLNRRYHYPYDQTHVELNQGSLLHNNVEIHYDALAADPDYLVVGKFAGENGLYEPVIASGAFRVLKQAGGYTIYQRVR